MSTTRSSPVTALIGLCLLNPRLRKLITGIAVRQEYICLPLDDLKDPLTVYATAHDSNGARDVTSAHALVGYKPALIALPVSLTAAPSATEPEICLSFVNGDFALDTHWQAFPTSRNSVARLALRRIREHRVDALTLGLYEGSLGEHRFLNRLHRNANNWIEARKKKPPNNIGLPGNLYEQVRIAYSVPRLISIVSLCDAHGVSCFRPTCTVPSARITTSVRCGLMARHALRWNAAGESLSPKSTRRSFAKPMPWARIT